MDCDTQFDAVKKIFNGSLPTHDGRAKIQTMDFVTSLVLCFTGDSKIFSLEAIRRKIMGLLDVEIPRSSFWDRLSTKSLTTHLQNLLGHFMGTMEIPLLRGQTLLTALNVKSIYLIDSTSISLWDNLKKLFPGTRTTAGVKWHACFNLLTGMLEWFDITSTSSNDRKSFPCVKDLKDALIVFDLGYFDYGLMNMIDEAKGYFLSRVKANANIRILLPLLGIGENFIGRSIDEIRAGHEIVDFIGEVYCQEHGIMEMRFVGFWNKEEKIYHWYMTNLKVEASIIYPLYRLRWQIELIFKSCKTSLNLNEIPTGNKNIVINLLLSTILAYLVSLVTLDVAKKN